jgi:hypothetical protein
VTAPAGFAIERNDPTLTLLVARRSGVHVIGGHVNVADDAREALRANADSAIEDLETKEVRQYDPDAHLEVGEYFLLDRAAVEDSMEILGFLDVGPESQLLTPDDVADRPQLFYATLIGREPRRRLAFVSKSNPAKVVRRGVFMTPKREVLTKIDDDVFLFEDRVDLIVSHDQIVVFNQPAFEQWFRDTPVLQERVKDWIGRITEHLPLDGDGAERQRNVVGRTRASDAFSTASRPGAISRMYLSRGFDSTSAGKALTPRNWCRTESWSSMTRTQPRF